MHAGGMRAVNAVDLGSGGIQAVGNGFEIVAGE